MVMEAVSNLQELNFDPEFFKQYEKEIVGKYNQETGRNVKLKAKKGLFGSFWR